MSHSSNLKSLEELLESFLERAVAAKGHRLNILNGINRLDDIARDSRDGLNVVETIGEWFADHAEWLDTDTLRHGDLDRMDRILAAINGSLSSADNSAPAASKIRSELERWNRVTKTASQKLVLKRAPEAPQPATDSVVLVARLLERLTRRYHDLSDSKKHVLSVLDDTLQSAQVQKDEDALLLSAFLVYYLKLNGYKVDPYVRRLKRPKLVSKRRSAMLDPAEKAYCLALLALKRKDYSVASDHFHRAAARFTDNREFNLLRETTELLLAVKKERMKFETEDRIELEEVLPHGEEKIIRR